LAEKSNVQSGFRNVNATGGTEMTQASHLIKVLFLGPSSYLAIDEGNDFSANGRSVEEAAVNLICRNAADYGINFVDLSHCNLSSGATGCSYRGTADIVIFGDRRGKVIGFRATVRSGGGRIEAFHQDIYAAAFNLICCSHPVFNIDFDLTGAYPASSDPEEPEMVLERTGRQADC
jgi:hypothetical protein